jgi:hypothetical protein
LNLLSSSDHSLPLIPPNHTICTFFSKPNYSLQPVLEHPMSPPGSVDLYPGPHHMCPHCSFLCPYPHQCPGLYSHPSQLCLNPLLLSLSAPHFPYTIQFHVLTHLCTSSAPFTPLVSP